MPEDNSIPAAQLVTDAERYQLYLDASAQTEEGLIKAMERIDEEIAALRAAGNVPGNLDKQQKLEEKKEQLDEDLAYCRERHDATTKKEGSVRPPTSEDVGTAKARAQSIANKTGDAIEVDGAIKVAGDLAKAFRQLYGDA